jgi:hypothetical protein
MFEEATSEEAVLLLDEADSFLRSRRRAERNYEVTEVNEMLQGMERFAGIFVCTTNLFEDLDEAALRRFTFKIRFHPLRPEQREQMFVAEALGGDGAALSAEQRQRLAQLDQLVPGDFAAVQRQVEILGLSFDPDGFLAQLEGEHRVKPEVRDDEQIQDDAFAVDRAGRGGADCRGPFAPPPAPTSPTASNATRAARRPPGAGRRGNARSTNTWTAPTGG